MTFSKSIRKVDRPIFDEAIKLRDDDKFSEALILIEQLVPKYPQNNSLLMIAAHLHWEIGSLDIAASFFKSATQVSPKSEKSSLGLFHCLWEMGKQVEALDEVKRFMSVSSSKEYMEIVREINQGQN